MDFLVAPVRVARKDGKLSGLECLKMSWGAGRQRPPQPEADPRIGVPRGGGLGDRRHRPEHPGGAAGRGKVPTSSLRREPEPDRWQTIQVTRRPSRPAWKASSPGGRVTAPPRPSRRSPRPQGGLCHRRLRPDGEGRAGAGGILQPQGLLQDGDGGGPPRRLSICSPADAGAPPRRAGQELRRGGAGVLRRDLKMETGRCLECGCVALFTCDLRRYATEYGADISSFLERRSSTASIDPSPDRAGPEQVHPLRPLRPDLRELVGSPLRVHQPGFNTVVRPSLGGSSWRPTA